MTNRIIDMHCDTLTRLADNHASLKANDGHLSIEKLNAGGYLMQCMAVFLHLNQGNAYNRCNAYMDQFDKWMIEYKNQLAQVKNPTDLQRLIDEDKLGVMLTIEEGGVLEGKLENLDHFYNRGVRMLTLTWNFENEIAYPNDMSKPPFGINTTKGLKVFGQRVVHRMNELGMIIDVSHLGDAGIYDVLALSQKPIVASHSNSRAICDVPRNMTDDMIRKLAANGGMMGLNYCAAFVNQDGRKTVIDGLVRHAQHIAEVGGIDCLGLGSDFDGIGDLQDLTGGDKVPLLLKALADGGFTSEDLEKICYKNFMRVFKAQHNI